MAHASCFRDGGGDGWGRVVGGYLVGLGWQVVVVFPQSPSLIAVLGEGFVGFSSLFLRPPRLFFFFFFGLFALMHRYGVLFASRCSRCAA